MAALRLRNTQQAASRGSFHFPKISTASCGTIVKLILGTKRYTRMQSSNRGSHPQATFPLAGRQTPSAVLDPCNRQPSVPVVLPGNGPFIPAAIASPVASNKPAARSLPYASCDAELMIRSTKRPLRPKENLRHIGQDHAGEQPVDARLFSAETPEVKEALAAKRRKHKASEKARRDQMKDGLGRLALLLSAPCCDAGQDIAASARDVAGTSSSVTVATSSKANTIIAAIRYIICLQRCLTDGRQYLAGPDDTLATSSRSCESCT